MIKVSKWVKWYYDGIHLKTCTYYGRIIHDSRTWTIRADCRPIRFCVQKDVFWFDLVKEKMHFTMKNGFILPKYLCWCGQTKATRGANEDYCFHPNTPFILAASYSDEVKILETFEKAMRNEDEAKSYYYAKWYLGLASVRRSIGGIRIPKDIRRLLVLKYFVV